MAAVESELEKTYGYTEQQIDTEGLKIVTTFNERLMNALYAAVNQNLAQMRADGQPLPNYAHIGAVLEKPGTGAILAMYGGPSFSARNCARINCQWNMALQNREQVGSSFKPYVLSTAVSEGMDVQDSILNGIEPMCIPPDTSLALQDTLSTESTNCPPDWFPVNIAGENSGHGLSVPVATAISSDPAYEDLIHKAGTQATINMAKAFGVNTIVSGLQQQVHEVGLALGIGSLTVEEQATTFATLANDGQYVTPHVIAQITKNQNGTTVNVPLKITRRQVLTPAQAADVDFALSFDTSPGGTAFPNGVLNPNRPTIGKTGTTDDEQSAFFLGAIPQYSFAVGMFTNDQNGQSGGQSLGILPSVNGQPSGNGGNWPATIWQSYMQDEFAGLPIEPLPTPDYTGFTMWDQVPPQPVKPKPKANPNPCPPGHHHFGLCPPTGTQPNPLPTPPFGGGILGANAVGAVLLQAARIRRWRRRRRGGRAAAASPSPGILPPSSG
jgi:membrane peptidoglycan carboxypeptidase